MRGYHSRTGIASGTRPEDIAWFDGCAECGADLRGTETEYSVEPLRRLLLKGSKRLNWKNTRSAHE